MIRSPAKTSGGARHSAPKRASEAPNDLLADDRDAIKIFETAPISLWLEDYSVLKQLFESWRAAGISDLKAYLREDPDRVRTCSQALRVLKVNAATLRLFDADSVEHLVDNLDRVFSGDMLGTFVEELVQLWDGSREFRGTSVNYGLGGRRIDIQLKGTVLEGHEDRWDRVLVAVEDVTERETALRRVSISDSYARGLFEHSPISLWVEDFSGVRLLLNDLRSRGIEDFRTFTDVHPDFVVRCMAEIRVIDVNQHTIELFGAPSKVELLRRLGEVFRGDMQRHFREQLVDLWDGKLFQRREVVNYALDGTELHLHMQFSVLPGSERDWSLVQVALTDITARKKAEAYLEFLGKHDVLTKLCNRSFYNDELNQIERKAISPVSIVMADLNGLKEANDQNGHAAGDSLLRRAGEIFTKAVDAPWTAARIGGDEFAVLMPHANERDAEILIASLMEIVELNNQFHTGCPLSMSIGVATSRPGERLEAVARRADLAMYEAKKLFYEQARQERRSRR